MARTNYDPVNRMPDIEMHGSPQLLEPSSPNEKKEPSTTSTLLPSDTSFETSRDANRSSIILPRQSKTKKQFWHILIKSLIRWVVTVALCVAYILALRVWNNKGTVSEDSKRVFNAVTTGISMVLGINIAAALSDVTLDARWTILNQRTRNLNELDYTLNADSLTDLAKLAFVSRRPLVFLGAILWVLFNLGAQVAVASISLTYGFDTSTSGYLFSAGNLTIPDMAHFYPNGNNTAPEIEDEEYTAHVYGSLAWSYIGASVADLPKPREIYSSDANFTIWEDQPNDKMVYVFTEASSNASQNTVPLTVYTNRTISIHYSCDSYPVIGNGNGSQNGNITVKGLGSLDVATFVSNGTTFFTALNNTCPGIDRCSVVQAFEASDTDPWYYTCNITLGNTQNDAKNLSFVSDMMAYIATSAIAQTGYSLYDQQTTSYPRKTQWGLPMGGNGSDVGRQIAAFGIGSISNAAFFNPSTWYEGMEPHSGFELGINHAITFVLSVFGIAIIQLLICVIAAFWVNRVHVYDRSPLEMSLLLRPIADTLYAISGGKENKAFREAKRTLMVRYEQGGDGSWGLKMK